jgi:hypothetical protein
MHSLTKYVSGRSDMMGGALISKKELIQNIAHPGVGEASLIGAMLHPPVAQEMAERLYQLEDRVREASVRAGHLADMLRRYALLTVNYPDRCPMVSRRFDAKTPCYGGVLSVHFPSEAEGVRFVDLACAEMVDDPMFGTHPLATPMVSLGSAHTYVWCATEARVQSNVTKWKPLPFVPVPFGSVRIAVGYGGDRSQFLESFYNVLYKLKSSAPT